MVNRGEVADVQVYARSQHEPNLRVDSSKMPAWGDSLTHLKTPAWERIGTKLELAVRRPVTAVMVRKYVKAQAGKRR